MVNALVLTTQMYRDALLGSLKKVGILSYRFQAYVNFYFVHHHSSIFLFSTIAKQYPRKFADQRDSGYFLGFWDEGPPKNQLLYSNEVISSVFELISISFKLPNH